MHQPTPPAHGDRPRAVHAREHLSATVLKWVNSRYAENPKATVYNTLNCSWKELIRELVVDPAKIVYDPNTEPHHHSTMS